MPLSHEKAVMLGARGGLAGRGKKHPKTLEKEKQREVMNQMILRKTRPLVRAGMSVALGQQFVYRIDEEYEPEKVSVNKNTGEEYMSGGQLKRRVHILVTDPEEIADALDDIEGMGVSSSGKYYYITTKEPDYKAIEMLLNRPYGKPTESKVVDVNLNFSLTALAKKRDEMLNGNADMLVIDEASDVLESVYGPTKEDSEEIVITSAPQQ